MNTIKVKQAQIMIVAAHPDDAEFGIGGTVAKWTQEGKSIVYIICTNGDKGTSDITISPKELTEIRRQEQIQAAELLGVKDVVFLGYPDQGLEDNDDFRKSLVKQIRIYQPRIVAVTDPFRRYISHRDHRIAGQVALDAVYPYARDHLAYPDLFAAGYKPHKVSEVLCWDTDNPNYWSDITGTFDIKMKAILCHSSQVGKRDFDEFYGKMKTRAADMAMGKKFKLAEAFHRVVVAL
jgi:LmbE family N-acetylglucosaminyl deacetylase